MAITDEQREARKSSLGSSDMAAVLGLDEYRSSYDVFLEKTGQAPGFEGNAATDRGNLLEPALLDWAESKLGRFNRAVMKRLPEKPIAANFDGISVSSDGFIVEAKTVNGSDDSIEVADQWGEAGTDEVPDRVIVQTHTAMLVAGPEYRIAYVPMLVPMRCKFAFRMYVIDRRDELCEVIDERGCAFWRDHVLTGIPPSDSKPSIEVLKRLRRTPGKVADVSPKLIDDWIVCGAAEKQAKGDLESAKARLITAIQDAEAATDGARMLTYFETRRKGYEVKETTYRTLRLKGVK